MPSNRAADLVLAEDLWTPKRTAAFLSVSLCTLWRFNKLGRLCPVRIGRAVRYEPAEVRRFVAGCRSECSKAARLRSPSV